MLYLEHKLANRSKQLWSLEEKMAWLKRREAQAQDDKSEAKKKGSELALKIQQIESDILDTKDHCWGTNFNKLYQIARKQDDLPPIPPHSTLSSIRLKISEYRDAEYDLTCSNVALREDVKEKEKIIAQLEGRQRIMFHTQRKLMEDKSILGAMYDDLARHNAILADRNRKLEVKKERDINKLEKDKAKVIEHNKKLKKANKTLQHNVKKLKQSLMEMETQVK